jgi:hypothetical protein
MSSTNRYTESGDVSRDDEVAVHDYRYVRGAVVVEFDRSGTPIRFFVTKADSYVPVTTCGDDWTRKVRSAVSRLGINYLLAVGGETYGALLETFASSRVILVETWNEHLERHNRLYPCHNEGCHLHPCVPCEERRCMKRQAQHALKTAYVPGTMY